MQNSPLLKTFIAAFSACGPRGSTPWSQSLGVGIEELASCRLIQISESCRRRTAAQMAKIKQQCLCQPPRSVSVIC